MKISCQFALYPLKQENVGEVLGEAALELDRLGISCQVGRVSTEMQGEEDQVWCGEGEDNRRPEIHAKLRAARSVPPSQRMDVAQ